jgi:hypothetical protein
MVVCRTRVLCVEIILVSTWNLGFWHMRSIAQSPFHYRIITLLIIASSPFIIARHQSCPFDPTVLRTQPVPSRKHLLSLETIKRRRREEEQQEEEEEEQQDEEEEKEEDKEEEKEQEGVDVEQLEKQLEEAKAKHLPLPQMIYIIPTHHNPTG